LQAHEERVGHHRVAELCNEPARRDAGEDGEHGEREESKRDEGREEDERRCRQPAQLRPRQEGPDHRSTITEVDLTTAVAGEPGFRPSSSTASRVTIATTRTGSVTRISTWASSPSTFTSRTVPGKRLRALPCCVPSSPRRRATSLALITRRLALSRRVRIRPSRSHRRSVSRLIPSA